MKSVLFALLVFLTGCSTQSTPSQTQQNPIPSSKGECFASNESGCCMGRGGVCTVLSNNKVVCCDDGVVTCNK